MSRAWRNIQAIPEGLWTLGKGVVQGATTDTAAGNAGFVRGGRDFTDYTAQYGNPEYGAPIPDDPDAVGRQNAADRAAFDKQYGDNAAAQAGRTLGNMAMTLPLTSALGGALGVAGNAVRGVLPAVMTRGPLGLGTRTVERAVTGGTQGAAQTAATADPSKPLGPQIEAGAETGAIIPAGAGVVTDPARNVVSRLSGGTITPSPGLGRLPDSQVDRAKQAQTLIDAKVPVYAAQVSGDPLLQTSARYGGSAIGSGLPDRMITQTEKYRAAVLNQMGDTSGGSLVDDDFNARTDARTQQLYDNSVNAVGAIPAGRLGTDLGAIRSQLSSALKPEDTARINATLDNVAKTFNNGNGSISGADYQVLRRNLSPLFNSTEPDVRVAGWRIKQLLDQRAQSVMTQPQIDDFKAANDTYRAQKTLQGATGTDHMFTPGSLSAEAARVSGIYNDSPGIIDDLAHAGNTIIQPTIAQGQSTVGRVGAGVSGVGSTLGASGIALALNKLLAADLLTSGGTGTAIGTGALTGNRVLQELNYRGGPRAIATAQRGGAPLVSKLQQALQTLRLPTTAGVAAARNVQEGQPP
jgi:hypothetical protein